jgi:hypothetical protein
VEVKGKDEVDEDGSRRMEEKDRGDKNEKDRESTHSV